MDKRRAMAGSSNLFVQLARTLDCLPSAEERDRLLAGFAVIRALVERLEQSFQVLPSQTDAAQARRAVEDIRAFGGKARAWAEQPLDLLHRAEVCVRDHRTADSNLHKHDATHLGDGSLRAGAPSEREYQ
jgi:hypothetical protein